METLRQEFRPRNFGVQYNRRDVFYRSQWPMRPVLFVVYRILMCVYVTVWLFINACVYYHRKEPIVVWLTYWGYTILCLHLVTAAIITTYHTYKTGVWRALTVLPVEGQEVSPNARDPEADRKETRALTNRSIRKTESTGRRPERIPWYMKMSWIFYNIACITAIEVTALYFFFLYKKIAQRKGIKFPTVDNFHIHAFNSVVVLLEIILSAYPWRLLHFIYPIIFGVLYMLCTVLYWAHDHTYVLYGGMINWNKPGKTFVKMVVMGLICTIVVHLIFYGFYKLRVYIAKRITRQNTEEELK